ncbi:MAG: efflux RND transporter permease subunit [Candidatus Saccharimonadales bacterium]
MPRIKAKGPVQSPNRPLQRLTLFFFNRPRLTAGIALAIALFGVLSYTTLLRREGFPPINIPYAIGQGTYFGKDAATIDREVAGPLSDFLLKQPDVKTVQTTSLANFISFYVQFEEKADAVTQSKDLLAKVAAQHVLPDSASIKLEPARFGFTERGDDAVVSFFAPKQPRVSETALIQKAQDAAAYIKNQRLSLVKDASIISPVQQATVIGEGTPEQSQTKFERYGEREGGKTVFYSSVPIGVSIVKGGDVVTFGDQLAKAIKTYNETQGKDEYALRLSASYAPSIRQQISELQKTLLEGLLAVLIIGSIVIAVRASLLIVISMITVLLATLGLLELIGYTLNTITLFSLVLALSLIVDDTIIMVEALDAQRKRKKNGNDIVGTSVGKVGRAMIAATSTAALSFAPLLFVGGILGGFIRAIPVTIISALLISLVVALLFIPFFARFIMLGRKHVGTHAEHEVAADFEATVARKLSAPMLWARHSKKKLAVVGLAALLISFIFIGTGGYMFQKVKFNIFPPSKDTNQLVMNMQFPAGTDIAQAEAVSDRAYRTLSEVLGKDFRYGANYGAANAQSAQYFIELTDYNDRKTTAPEYIEQLDKRFANFSGAQISVRSMDAGPPASDFTARILPGKNRAGAEKLAADVVGFLKRADIQRADGTKVNMRTVSVDNTDAYTRADGDTYIGVTAVFADTDTTALVTLTKDAVEKEFTHSKVASYGLSKDALSFDFGQEDENQDSFKTLAIAFPLVLLAIYAVLALQFRSFLQPLLIFMAIPFSLFGITLGLWLTNNPFSFFAMLGFFALIGLSIKNTILLTDYANQARRAGMNPVDAAHEALAERFRPLVATSLTAVVSLIPLALSSPFWQGLAVVLIFGLLSSTLMVVTVFPYYYLAGEFLRGLTRRLFRRVFRRTRKRAA